MSLTGKLISQIEIKSRADVFHELFRHKPHHNIQNCDLHDGEWDNVGSVIVFNYTVDGKKCVAKERIEAIDEEKKLVTFKIIEGDLMELYDSMTVTVHVETHGESNLVTWTCDYEKLNETTPEPYTLMALALSVTNDIETHHLM